jgi:hypothetical protein
MAYTVDQLLGTSAEDLKASLRFIEDVELLRRAHQASVERELITKTLFIERRLKQLRKETQHG